MRYYTECVQKAGLSGHPNYALAGKDAVINMMESERLFMYSMVFVDGRPVAASGVRLNVNVDGLGVCAQCGVRMMSVDRTGEGLRRYPYALAHLVPLEVECAVSIGYEKHILTFNDYNYRLAKNLPRVLEHPAVPDLMRNFKMLDKQYQVNGVDQYVMMLYS